MRNLDVAKVVADNLDRELDEADRELLQVVDAAFAEGARRAGSGCACRVGCTACCVGPFPITLLDARRLRRGLGRLAQSDPETASRVRDRAREAVAAMSATYPGDVGTGLLADSERDEKAFCERHASMPCPALDPETGRCDLYESRPISCRAYGPPVRAGEERLAPCDLWFRTAPGDEACVEASRVTIDPDGLEAELLDDIEALEQRTGETVVAFALTKP